MGIFHDQAVFLTAGDKQYPTAEHNGRVNGGFTVSIVAGYNDTPSM